MKVVLRLLEKARKDTGRDITVHQSRMNRRRTSRRYLLYGFITAYWACVSGHRPSVFVNMRTDEVEEAGKDLTEEGVLVRVEEHKTTTQFGEANLALTPREYSWAKRLIEVKENLRARNRFLLFTPGKLCFKNINPYLKLAWRSMGLKGDINFTLIRTALADSAKTLLPPEERAKVSMAKCHDVKTADRFYSRNPSLQEAMRVRNMMAETLLRVNQPCTPPGQAGSSSSAQQIPWTEPGPCRPVKKAPAKRRRRTDSSSDSDPDSGVPDS
ncbi:uncharacterized protein V3H82_023590 [Fundulus diaphanus]